MTTTPLQLSSSSLLWKQLMDNGIFDDCYPQRLNASFHYLCSDNVDTTTFSLKDLIQKGPYIFTYLSIDVDKDSSFAIMDIFRAFDRSGRGSVFLEEFVLGILERLNAIKKNTELLENIADDLLSIESRCTELATLLEKERTNNSNKFTNYNRNLKSLSNIIRPYIRSSKATQYLSALDVPGLIRIFEQSIIHAAAEVQVYFHIPDSRMTGTLTDLTVQRDHLKVGHQLRMIWNMNAPPSTSSAASSTSSSALPLSTKGDDVASSRVLSINRGDGGGVGGGGDESELWMKDSPEALLSNILSGVDESRFKRLRFDASNLHMQSQEDMMHVLKDLLPAETMAMLESGYVSDNVQLHVLQDAFVCINNFFQLQQPHTALVSTTTGNSAGDDTGSDETRHHTSSRSERGGGKNLTSSNTPSSPSKASKKRADVTMKLAEYRELLGLDSSSSPSDVSGGGAGNATDNESTVLIAVLAEDLLRTQETLLRTQQRLKILELIQSDMMAMHYRLTQEEEEKEKQRNSGLAAMFPTVGSDGDDHSHSTLTSQQQQQRRAISERINNHNPKFHHLGGGGEVVGSDEGGVVGNDVRGFDDYEAEHVTLHHEDSVTYEEILRELASLETCLAERSRTDYALGLLLDRPVTLLDDSTHVIAAISSNSSSSDNDLLTSLQQQNAAAILAATSSLVDKLGEEMKGYVEQVGKRDALTSELRMKEELLTEYRTRMEQIDIERSDWISMNAELQILREKLQKHQKEEHTSRILEQKNQDLTKRVLALEEQLLSFQEIEKKYQKTTSSSSNTSTSQESSNNRGVTNENSSNNNNNNNRVTSEEAEKLRDSLLQLQSANVELSQQSEQYQKEIQRLKTTIALSEQRVKSILQDSMVLHQNIQVLEEENMNSKATVTKLLREVEDMKNLRQYKEESERRMFEYQKEMMKREVELAESRENNILINKYHNDLITAERTIESLEQKLAEYVVELEKGKIASSQLDNYREGMKGKLQEIRDLSLYIHQLENQLKDVPYLTARFQELSSELADSKVKVDKIPGLLAEIARLRGSSRASIKALMEQDKLISTMKNRLKLLEKDNALLKHENQSLLDLEMKVKEANQEIKRLMNIITDLQSSSNASGNTSVYGERSGMGMGGQLANKAMTMMMLNKFTTNLTSSLNSNNSEGDDASISSSTTPNKSSANPSTPGGSGGGGGGGRKGKKYSQTSIIVPMPTPNTPLSRVNSNSSNVSGNQNTSSNTTSGNVGSPEGVPVSAPSSLAAAIFDN